MKCIRAYTRTKKITFNKEKAQQNIDVGVLGMHSNYQAANLASRGDYEGAILQNLQYQQLISHNITTPSQQADYSNWVNENNAFNAQMQYAQQQQQPLSMPAVPTINLPATKASTGDRKRGRGDAYPKTRRERARSRRKFNEAPQSTEDQFQLVQPIPLAYPQPQQPQLLPQLQPQPQQQPQPQRRVDDATSNMIYRFKSPQYNGRNFHKPPPKQ